MMETSRRDGVGLFVVAEEPAILSIAGDNMQIVHGFLQIANE